MRRIRYQVACSLDGYIADTAGQTSWIVHEPGIDFTEYFDQFDTLLMGRRTYEGLQHNGFALRNYLTLMAYAGLIEKALTQ